MRRPIALLLILAIALPAAARRRSVSVADPFIVPSADSIAAAALAEGIPSVTIAVRKGTALFTRSYGVFDLELGVEARPDTVYQIASVTKQFTAAAIVRLKEMGKLALDDRAGLYLPELDQRFDAISIRDLLNHTSGLHEYLYDIENPFEPMSQQQIIAMITSEPTAFTPGSQFEYSNSGYFLLGVIIERVSARSYEQFLRETFFEPLGLRDTSYCGTREPSPAGSLLFDGQLIPLPPADMSLVGAAGALCSTAADLIRWNVALSGGLAVATASFDAMIGQTAPMSLGLNYGFGLVIDTRASVLMIWHNGSILGFQSMLLWIPERDLMIAVLVNMTDLDRDRAGEIALALAQSLQSL